MDSAEPAAAEEGREPEAPITEIPGMEWWAAGPPWWFSTGTRLLTGLTSLCFALVVMLQWGLWLIVTGNLFSPWGMALGVVIAAAQILALFDNRSSKGGSCALPRSD